MTLVDVVKENEYEGDIATRHRGRVAGAAWGFPWEMNRASLAAAADQEQANQIEPGGRRAPEASGIPTIRMWQGGEE